MKLPILQDRLMAAAAFVREGAFLADVGTDHAYLPVYLQGTGRIRGALASDINKGPLESARRNIKAHGFEKNIATLLCDGLAGVEAYAPEDIAILGMGGELIARILADAPFVKNGDIRLILQPMSRAEELREYLAHAGFAIVDEALVAEGRRIYQIICAEYDGISRVYTEVEALLGEKNIARGGALFLRFLKQKKSVYEKILAGKQGAEDAAYEKKILEEIEKLIEKETAI